MPRSLMRSDAYSRNLRLHRLNDTPATFFITTSLHPKKPVLDEVARKKNIVVATMDTEFRSLVLKDVTKAKTEYTYASWTPARGPLVTNGEMK